MPEMGAVKSIRDQIADHLREDIFCGRFGEGDRLNEVALAKRFGVSRGPIRDALLQLTHEGLLSAKPNCGVSVAPVVPDTLGGLIIPIRRTLETYALRSVFDRLSDADFNVWGEILARLEHACRNRDLPGILNNDLAFHRAILDRAPQPDLLAIWRTLVGRVRNYFWTAVEPYEEDLLEVYRMHRDLLETFKGGDVEVAARALEEHIW